MRLLSWYSSTYLRLLIGWLWYSNLGLASKERLYNGFDPILQIDYNNYVCINGPNSFYTDIVSGVPQGSPFGDVIRRHAMEFHFYAHDSQIYFSFDYSSSCLSVVSRIQACSSNISCWMSLRKFKFNGDKTGLLFIGPQFRPTLQFPPVVLDDGSLILPSKYARNIGVTFDSVLNIAHHTTDICKSCYFNIHIYRIRKFLSTELTKIFVNAFVTSRLDDCHLLLHGLSRDVLHKVQLVQNCAARLFLGGYK